MLSPEGASGGEARGLRAGLHAATPWRNSEAYDGQPTLQRAAVRHEAVGATRGSEGGTGPPLRRGDVAEDRFAQRAEHGQLGVLLDEPSHLEPAEPAHDRVDPTRAVGRHRHLDEQARGAIGVTRGLGVLERERRALIGVEPRRRPVVQARDVGPDRSNSSRRRSEQVVTPVLPSLAVEGNDEQVRRLEPLRTCAPAAHHRAAERSARLSSTEQRARNRAVGRGSADITSARR